MTPPRLAGKNLEQRVVESLQRFGSATGAVLQERLGINPLTLFNVLKRLKQKKLVKTDNSFPRVWGLK